MTTTENAIDTAVTDASLRGFVSLRGYRNSKGEVSDYLFNGAVSYRNYNDRKVAFLTAALAQARNVTLAQVLSHPSCSVALLGKTLQKRYGTDEGMAQALLADVIQGYEGQLARATGEEPFTRTDNYEPVAPGVKRHEDGSLHAFGLHVRKTVREEVKVATKRPATLVKDFIKRIAEQGLDMPAWVQFKLEPGRFESCSFGGQTISGAVAEQAATA